MPLKDRQQLIRPALVWSQCIEDSLMNANIYEIYYLKADFIGYLMVQRL